MQPPVSSGRPPTSKRGGESVAGTIAPINGRRPLALDEDRLFDPDPSVRHAARAIYEETLAALHATLDEERFAAARHISRSGWIAAI